MYIIVIDVDNNRARMAYKRGLDDLARVWGQLMHKAEEKYSSDLAQYNVDYALWEEYDNKLKQQRKEQKEAYKVALAEWTAAKNSFWGSSIKPKPIDPFYYYNSYLGEPLRPVKPTQTMKLHFESIKEELTNKYNLADAAIGPFRMTEGDVKVMIAWEDGSRVEKLLSVESVSYYMGQSYEE